jgi:RNA polymerase sigma-70 factor, ECF subfamily
VDGSIAAQGSLNAIDWESVYIRDAEEILRFLMKLTAHRDVASDLLQETFVQAIKREAQLRDPDSVRSWLFGIATNLARQHRRRAKLVRFLPFSGRERTEERFDLGADTVHRALESIPYDQAAALVLHYRAGFTRHEIAQISGVSDEAVKSRLGRGRANFIAAYHRLERGLRG